MYWESLAIFFIICGLLFAYKKYKSAKKLKEFQTILDEKDYNERLTNKNLGDY